MANGAIGIVVSGGPAPGINAVIWSIVIEAHNSGVVVKGLSQGFRDVSTGQPHPVVELNAADISRIHNRGGSILGISRHNPFLDPQMEARFLATLQQHGIDKLVVIGGEGSAYLSYQLSVRQSGIQVVHVPKTIDNDLLLPHNYPSFGFETARSVGSSIVDTLMVDSKTEANRWFFVTSMGRRAGFLALGLGLAAGATLTVIPEEFKGQRVSARKMAEPIFSAIKRRRAMGKNYGVVVAAEGLIDNLDPAVTPALRGCERDDLGRVRYSEVELDEVLLPELKQMCAEEGFAVRFTGKNIGYELRCHDPGSFDLEYTKLLGYGAVRQLLAGHSGVMVVRDYDRIGTVKLAELLDDKGLMRSRSVDLNSDLYKVARSFMIR